MATGFLQTHVSTAGDNYPIKNARVITRDKAGRILFDQLTDASGNTDYIELYAPEADLTLSPDTATRSYNVVDVEISAEGFHPVVIHDVEIVAGERSYLPAFMHPNMEEDINDHVTRLFNRHPTVSSEEGETSTTTVGPAGHQVIQVPPPLAIQGNPTGQDPQEPSIGETPGDMDIVVPPPALLQEQQAGQVGPPDVHSVRRVFIPTYITVHLGRPDNRNARNVKVPFVEYVANVASSEIFPTWPDASLRANIHAITTFALNRIYTEWYRSRGMNFDITNSTAFDQYYVHGRNIFQNIMQISAEIFNQYVRRIGFSNPHFTSYCNGTTARCPGLSQWGTVTLANQGRTPLEIIRHFYGPDMEINTSNDIQDIRSTYPGTPMRLGDESRYVQLMQQYLNRIRQNFPAIPLIENPNGTFDTQTDAAVRAFQRTFNMPQDGVIGQATWNRITQLFVSVSRLAELDSEGTRIGIGPNPPNVTLRQGSSGHDVRQLQWLLDYIGTVYEFVPGDIIIDGRFGPNTANNVREFQRNFGINPDGVVGPATWNRIYEVFRSIQTTNPEVGRPPVPTTPQPPTPPTPPVTPPTLPPVPPTPPTPPEGFRPPYPGYLIRQGQRSDNVRTLQRLLNCVRVRIPTMFTPPLNEDGVFGPLTLAAVRAFQSRFGLAVDGIVGPLTWTALVRECNA